MSNAARIFVILVLTLGFPLHNFVLRVAAASASECTAVIDRSAGEEGGQAVPDKPSPSCKVIATGPVGAVRHQDASVTASRFAESEEARSSWWPGGPEKPPKRG